MHLRAHVCFFQSSFLPQIVLDKGRIVQFDTPWNLIQEEGVFRGMCMNSGMMDELQSLAKAKLMGSGTW